MTDRSAFDERLEGALDCARRSWRIVILHGLAGDLCTCGDEACNKSRGKHPRFGAWGQKATCDPRTLRRQFSQFPNSNFGVLLGRESGIVDLENDSDAGEKLITDIFSGEIPRTPMFSSGRGFHRIFQWRDDLPEKASIALGCADLKLGAGFNVGNLGEKIPKSSQSVFPPSRHYSGKQYAWIVSPEECAVAAIPDSALAWMLERQVAEKQAVPVSRRRDWVSRVGAPTVESVIAKLRSSKQAAKFSQLFDIGDFGKDHSKADASLCGMLAFWTGPDPALIDEILRLSALMREKWERADYVERTIAYVLGRQGKFYEWRSPFYQEGLNVRFDAFSASSAPEGSADPIAEQPSHPPVPPIAEEMLSIPGFVNDVVEYTMATAPYPNRVLAFSGALSLLAMLTGRKVQEASGIRTNLYVLALAHSAAGKDHPRKVNVEILKRIGMLEHLGDAFASGEGIQDALYSTPAMLFQTDEFDGILRSIKESKEGRFEGITTSLLKLYTSSSSVLPMRRRADRPAQFIDQPHLCIFGTAIPNHYYEAVSERLLTNGLFARMLILEAGVRGIGQDVPLRPPPECVIAAARWWKEFVPGDGNLASKFPVPRVIEYEQRVRQLFADCKKDSERLYQDAQAANDDVACTVWGRVIEQSKKLALLYAVSANRDRPIISYSAVEWATSFAFDQARNMLRRAVGYVSANPFDELCLKVVRKLREASGYELQHSVLLKRMKLDADTFEKVIRTLVQRGDVEAIPVTTAGRPGVNYRLISVPGRE